MIGQPAGPATRQKIRELMQAGWHAEAATLLEDICRTMPGNAEAHYLLGRCYARLKRWDAAIDVLQQSIRVRPEIAQTHMALAGARRALGQREEAMNSLEAALEIDDGLAGAHLALAELLMSRDDYPAARNHLERALAINPGMSQVHLAMGRLEQAGGSEEKALGRLEAALEHDPQSVNALCAMGSCLWNLSRSAEAKEHYQRALDIAPDSVDAQAGLAMVCEFSGEHDEAISLIDPLIGKYRGHIAIAHAFGRTCRFTNRCEEAIEYIEETLKQPGGLPGNSRRSLHFVAGKVLDAMGRYDEAFAHYKAGNDLVTHLYEAAGNAQFITDQISTFTPGLFMQLPRARDTGRRLVFIVGMPRSGTSLTEQILAAHPAVYAAGELKTLNTIVRRMPWEIETRESYPACVRNLGQDDLNRMAGAYLDEVEKLSGGAEVVTDKMPHNFYNLGMIQLLFPRARIIHCVRDPLDTGLSIYFQNFLDEHDYAKDLFNIGLHYHQYQRLMAHWKQVLSLPILDVHYEDLVSGQERMTRRMLAFCDLEWDDRCLQFHDLDRAVVTASYDQVRQPLYTGSKERWRHYARYLDELREGLRRGY